VYKATTRVRESMVIRYAGRMGPLFSQAETTLIEAAMMTAPSVNDSHAWRRAVRRIRLVCRSVSDTWKFIPMVKER